MAIPTISDAAIDLVSYDPGEALPALMSGIVGPTSATATLLTAVSVTDYPPGYYTQWEIFAEIDLTGSFTYGEFVPVSGTITELTASVEGVELFSITGISADAGLFWTVSTSGAKPLRILMAGDDVVLSFAEGNQITVLNADLADVNAAIELFNYG